MAAAIIKGIIVTMYHAMQSRGSGGKDSRGSGGGIPAAGDHAKGFARQRGGAAAGAVHRAII
ncbi:hypothetical protein OA86_10730 [Kaistella jeonii]|uniref:Uncharacterized protein n=1 Tax=Kaistella jeonii TaxID=266749 RepID=A0A0C1F9B7_9FLAO|nr:hypothetical protein OA86_10730 [Kaistella jeonii]